ncbi:MAG: potassium channel protein [Planctomycetota bacterium]
MRVRKRLFWALLALPIVFVVGTAGYMSVEEGITVGQAAYMTIITISTVGYTEVWELSDGGRTWTAVVIVFGWASVTLAFATLAALMVSGEIRGILGRRKLEDKIAKLDGHFIICGYGRMGKLIGDRLRSQGKKVVVIETDDRRTMLAEEDGVPYVLADATDDDTLRQAGIDRAGGLVAAMGGDAANVFVTLSAANLRKDIPIIARAEFHDSEPKLKRAGATHVVCPHAIGAMRMANLLSRPAVAHVVDITTSGLEWEIEEVNVPAGSKLAGRPLSDLHLRKRVNATIIAIRRNDGSTAVNPGAEAMIHGGDSLVVIGPAGIAEALRKLGIEDAS